MKLSTSLSQSLPITSVYSAKQVLENEAKVAQSQKITMFGLMQSAGMAVFESLLEHWPMATKVLVLCGKGNNGGDGFIAAKLLKQANIKVCVLVTCTEQELKGDALQAYQDMLSAGVSDICLQVASVNCSKAIAIIEKSSADVVVDALLGIGFKGLLHNNFQQLVASINQQMMPVLSVDIPAGLCATTGSVSGEKIAEQAIVADHTVTFIAYKQGLLTGQAANFVGHLHLAPLAMNTAFVAQIKTDNYYGQFQQPMKLPKRLSASHKGDSGLLLAIGGGVGMPGAIRLASESALRCGAGIVSVACHHQNQAMVFNGRAELMLAPTIAKELKSSYVLSKAKAILIGPGLGRDNWAEQLLDLVIEQVTRGNKQIIVDADALTLLAANKKHYQHWILTPHSKEAAMLLHCDVASVEADRFAAVRNIAIKYGGVCLLKGAGSLISDGKRVVINNSGNAGMATGGMGDVLSGIISALVMQSDDIFTATCLAAYIHGASADIIANNNGQRGLLASDLFLPLQQVLNGKLVST